ncbi:hypothetical protein Pyn_06490 [Prunus yedoensis var. nudiflora]|uniref:C2 domain-containing protein n=1 Tax=Prunus yedoensis var. nudiflora TaxID=2094558 RepID=A0A314YG18_PRUYE|nr:hypothetical protein Pyn_06490 [Prunus yedoensis var. nudiflora]
MGICWGALTDNSIPTRSSGYRPLEITIVSASDLKDVNMFSKMDVYAAVSVSGDPRNKKQKIKTPVAKDGGTNPKWNNYSIKFTLDEAALLHNRLTLNIKLVSERSLGDTKIGKVQIPLKELFDTLGGGDDQKKQIKHVGYSVRTSSGKPRGSINFGYKFGDKFTVPVPEPPGGYPPPPHQQPGYGYAPPPQAGYGYPPQSGYGYPPQKPKRGGGNMALGMGAGLLGGLLIGDMIGDVGEMAAYDSGYDAGFGGDDFGGGGFDF